MQVVARLKSLVEELPEANEEDEEHQRRLQVRCLGWRTAARFRLCGCDWIRNLWPTANGDRKQQRRLQVRSLRWWGSWFGPGLSAASATLEVERGSGRQHGACVCCVWDGSDNSDQLRSQPVCCYSFSFTHAGICRGSRPCA